MSGIYRDHIIMDPYQRTTMLYVRSFDHDSCLPGLAPSEESKPRLLSNLSNAECS